MGGDRGGWALDTEARLARAALEKISFLRVVDHLHEAQVVHTVWPEQLLEDPACAPVLRSSRPVVASFSNDPRSLFERVPGLFSYARRWHCVGQSTKANREMQALGIPSVSQVSYVADFSKFPPRPRADAASLRAHFGLPKSAYIVSSFQRDSEGANLARPKTQKGAEIFCAILGEVQEKIGEGNLHVLLGGPRRHWIRAELRRRNIPFTFIGREVPEDDYPWQSIPAEKIAELLSASDLNLVTSRWEGAPRALLECAALGVAVLSPPEGIAEDLLNPDAIFRTIPEAVEKILADRENGSLQKLTSEHRARLEKFHSVEAVVPEWESVYSKLIGTPVIRAQWPERFVHHPTLHSWVRRWHLLREKMRTPSSGKILRADELSGQASAAVWVNDVSLGRAFAEKNADATLFDSFATWELATKAGWQPRNPSVLRDPPGAKPDLSPSSHEELLLCYAGLPEEGRTLCNELRKAIPGVTMEPWSEERLLRASLVVADSENAAVVKACLRHRVPVVYRSSEQLRELCGLSGLSYTNEDGRVAAVQEAWRFRRALAASISYTSAEDSEKQWLRVQRLAPLEFKK
jgi:glycosyltransferase involved in cell wall biosynthesis